MIRARLLRVTSTVLRVVCRVQYCHGTTVPVIHTLILHPVPFLILVHAKRQEPVAPVYYTCHGNSSQARDLGTGRAAV